MNVTRANFPRFHFENNFLSRKWFEDIVSIASQ